MFAVFFPSLMGVGILISGALLVSDWMRKLLPHGRMRKRHNVVIGIYGSIADAVEAAGYHLHEPWFLSRGLRRRWVYIAIAAAFATVGFGAIWAGVEFYNDSKGLFYRSPWATGLGYGVGAAAFCGATLCLTIGVVYRSLPKPLRRLVEHTSLGKIILPTQADHDEALNNLEKET